MFPLIIRIFLLYLQRILTIQDIYDRDIVLIVCGSATSWISKKLLKDKGGLRGRLTLRIKLVPFTLRECELFAQGANLAFGRKDILELYMILGGIPYYWSFLKKGLSVAQNVDRLFFTETAQLRDEFEALYATLFKRRGAQIDLVLQRADGFTDICEMKHSVNIFTIDNDYAKELQNKLDAYRELSRDKRTLHLIMITTNGVAHNNHYNMVQKEITLDELFAATP